MSKFHKFMKSPPMNTPVSSYLFNSLLNSREVIREIDTFINTRTIWIYSDIKIENPLTHEIQIYKIGIQRGYGDRHMYPISKYVDKNTGQNCICVIHRPKKKSIRKNTLYVGLFKAPIQSV